MRNKFFQSTLFILINLLAYSAYAQVRISGTVGNTSIRTVGTIKAAFDSINNGNFKGDIQIEIIGNTNELATATLLATGVGNSSYLSVNIRPVGGSFTINGNLPNLFIFNGATNVTIDGKRQAGDTLKFVNSLGSVFNIHSAAASIVIKNCIVKATFEYAIGINFLALGAGCRKITIENCDIGPSTGTLKNGILCSPSSTNVNSLLFIYKNRIFDVQLSAISLTKTTRSKIIGNRVFNTVTYLHSSSASGGYNIKSILVNDGGAYTIDSNIIGFENSVGTGVMKILANSVSITGFPTAYTPTGTARSMSYTAIECTFSKDSLKSSINGNVISNIAFYTGRNNTLYTKAFYGIRVLNGFVGIGDVVGNVVGSTTSRGSIYVATSAINTTACAISLVTENNSILSNNKIGGIDVSGTTNSSSGSFVGIFIQRSNSAFQNPIFISNNTVGNELSDNIRIGVLKNQSLFSSTGNSFLPSGSLGFAFGIHDRSVEVLNIGEQNRPNIIRNINLNVGNVVSSLEVRLIGIYASSSAQKISYNEIYNLKTNGNNLSLSNTNVSAAGMIIGAGSNSVISNNIIHDIFSTYPDQAIANVGIGIEGSSSCLVQSNKVYNLFVYPSIGIKSYIIGLYIPSVANSISVFNNMITLGVGQNKETNIAGIWTGGSASFYIYNNSIYIGGSSKNYNSICFQRSYLNGNNPTFVNIYNNIFINNRISPDSVDNFALSNNYKTVNATIKLGWGEQFSNNNFYFARNSSKLGYWNGNKNFKAWISASNCDSQSVSTTIPNFVDTLNGNLSIVVDSLSYALESAGIELSSNKIDYYGNSRTNPINTINNAGFSYDIGAVEFDGKAVDLQGPTIVFNHAKFQISTQKLRIDSVYITDKSGVNNAVGFKPRLYFKKSTDSNIFVSNSSADIGWKYVEATNTTSPYHFNPNFNLLHGDTPSNNTYVQYFILAQDLSPKSNISFMRARASGTALSVNLQSVNFPILDSIYSVKICKTCKELNGDYTVGGSINYPGIGTDYASIYDFLNDFEPGIIRRIRILNKGKSYSNAPIINFSGGGGSGAAAIAILNTDSTIKEVLITNPGKGYTSKPTIIVLRVGIIGSGLLLDLDVSNGAYFTGPTNLLLSNTYNNKNEIDIYSGSYFANGIKFTSLKAFGISEINKLTIKPAANTNHVFKNYSNVNPIIMFRHTEHICIDGSNNNSDSRNISFEYKKNASGSVLMAYSTMFDRGNKFITIKNCKIYRDTVFAGMTTLIGISVAGTNQTSGSIGYHNDNFQLINNEIYGCDFPIFLSGSNYRKDVNNIIRKNYLYNNIYPNKVIGIYAAYQENLLIEENYVAGMRSNTFSVGISLGGMEGGLGFSDDIFTGKARVSKNIIVDNLSSNTTSSVGIFANKSPQNAITLDNNLIYQKENSNSTKSTIGIFLYGNEDSQFNLYHNTVFLDGVKSATAALTEPSYNLAINNHCKLDIRNNIFYNNVTSTSTRKAVNIGLGYYNLNSGYQSFNSDYNLYYKSDSNSKLVYPYQVNSAGGIFIDSLNGYKALTNQDSHSIYKKIDFSLLNGIPRIDKSYVCDFDNLIPILSAYNSDVFNTMRSSTLVDYGAEEYTFNFGVSYKLNIDSCNNPYVDLTNPLNFTGNISNVNIGYYEDSLATIMLNRPDSITVSKKYFIKLTNLKCQEIIPVNVTTFTPVFANINLLNNKSCSSDTSSTIIISGVTNGMFSSDTGLFIDVNTGTINPSLSTVGQHIIQYTYQSTPFCFSSAFDTIIILNKANAVITSMSGFSFCDGDSILLTALPQDKYKWNTGDTTQSIFVHQPGMYTLVTNNTNCSDSTSVLVQHFPKSILAISVIKDTLYTDPNFVGYSWYKDSIAIPFASNYFIVPKASGTYEVYAMDLNSCIAKSEKLIYIYTSINLEGKEVLKIFPNPASTEIKLIGKDFYNSIKIYNIYGLKLNEIEYTNGSSIKIDELPAGMYLIIADGYTGKFIKN